MKVAIRTLETSSKKTMQFRSVEKEVLQTILQTQERREQSRAQWLLTVNRLVGSNPAGATDCRHRATFPREKESGNNPRERGGILWPLPRDEWGIFQVDAGIGIRRV